MKKIILLSLLLTVLSVSAEDKYSYLWGIQFPSLIAPDTPCCFDFNGDGVNDLLFVQGDDKVGIVRSLQVYSRWGELVYEGTDMTINDELTGWDGTFKGKAMNTGVFAWVAEVEFLDGHIEIYRGDVMLQQ